MDNTMTLAMSCLRVWSYQARTEGLVNRCALARMTNLSINSAPASGNAIASSIRRLSGPERTRKASRGA